MERAAQMLKRIDHIGIAVKDISRAATFYRDVLGLAVQQSEGEPWASVQVGDQYLLVFQTQRVNTSPVGRTVDPHNDDVGLDHISIEVDDLDLAARELESRGVMFLAPAVEDGGIKYRGFQDPDGNMLYILQHTGQG